MDAGALSVLDPSAMFVAAFGAFQGKIDGARQVAHARRDQQCGAAVAGEGVDGFHAAPFHDFTSDFPTRVVPIFVIQ